MFGEAPWYAFLFYLVPLAYVGVPASVLYLAFRFLRAYERRAQGAAVTQRLEERVELLEAQVANLAAENERLLDGQRFTQALLGARVSAEPQIVTPREAAQAT